jgi:methyl-accepting chemotaxis protein
MLNETVEFNLHSPDDANNLAESTEEIAVATVEQERPSLTGYELVADMMRRQDDVINELDDLNKRIEAAIQEISDARKIEDEATHDLQDAVGKDCQLERAA